MALVKKKNQKLKHLEKECPHCQEVVLEIAIKCRHCGRVIHNQQCSRISFEKPHHAEKESYMSRSLSGISQLLGLTMILFGLIVYRQYTGRLYYSRSV